MVALEVEKLEEARWEDVCARREDAVTVGRVEVSLVATRVAVVVVVVREEKARKAQRGASTARETVKGGILARSARLSWPESSKMYAMVEVEIEKERKE